MLREIYESPIRVISDFFKPIDFEICSILENILQEREGTSVLFFYLKQLHRGDFTEKFSE